MKKITSVKKLAKGGRQGTKESSGKSFSAGPSTSQSKSGFSVSGQGGGFDRNIAAIAQSPSVKQGIASVLEGGGQSLAQPASPPSSGIMGIAQSLIESLTGRGGAQAQQGGAPTQSMRPVMRGTQMQSPNLFGRFGDFLQGQRPLVGMGGVINYEGSTNQQSIPTADGGVDRRMNFTPPPSEPASAAVPSEKPSWWPDYLPWPPAPQSPYAPPTVMPPPANQAPPFNPYSTSYSSLQNAISGAQNPLMMGIGGMVRRP